MKHELVERLSVEEQEAPSITPDMYEGQKELPKSTKDIGKLSRSYLQSVLTFYGFAACGTKDELILHVGLITNKRAHLCFNREQKMFLDLIAVTKELILAKKRQSLCPDASTYKQRTFATPTVTSLSSNRPRYHVAAQTQSSGKARVDIPQGTFKENIHEIFDELTQQIKNEIQVTLSSETASVPQQKDSKDIKAAILQEGTRVCSFN